MLFDKDSESPTSNEENNFQSPFAKRITSKRFSLPEDDRYAVDLEYKDDVGFFWVYNYALTKKWLSHATGSVTAARNYMRREFTDFCMNKNNDLVAFWNKVCEDFERKKQEEHQEP